MPSWSDSEGATFNINATFDLYRRGLVFQVAATAAVIYDHITTMDLEIELIWRKKWSLVKVLYIINRYVGAVQFLYCTSTLVIVSSDELFNRLCPYVTPLQIWLSMLSLWAMQGIMIHRIGSMYQKYKKKVLILLMSAFVIESVAGCVVAIVWLGSKSAPQPRLLQSMLVCIPNTYQSYSILVLWILITLFDFLTFVLAVFQGVLYLRETMSTQRITALHRDDSKAPRGRIADTARALSILWTRHGSLMRILLRDSILFPFLGFVTSIFIILGWFVLPLGAAGITLTISAMLSPILGCRLILNLRETYYQPFGEEWRSVKFRERALEDIQFELSPVPSDVQANHQPLQVP